MSGERTWIGVDLGTQSVRALAVTDDGTVAASASHPMTSVRDTGPRGETRHEQDPHAWKAGVAAVLAEVAARVDAAAVGGLAVDGTSGTVVLVDDAGRPVTPGVMYNDARGADRLAEVQDAGASLWARLGHRVGPTWALPTLLALLDDHPKARIAHQTDVVTAWLTGQAYTATDTSTALKTGYDVAELRWPTEVLSSLGVDPDALPAVVLPGTPLGGLGAEAAAATGLRAGTPVLAGMTDGCAAQIGAGAVAPGSWNSVLGTTLVLKGVSETLLHDPAGTVYCHRGPEHGWWLPGGASSTGAAVLADLVAPARFDAITAELLDAPPASVPVAYPLAGTGERFPVAAPEAQGFWLDGATARPLDELVGAVGEVAAFAALAEGVAFVERMCVEHLAGLGADVSGERSISGGATANRWWNRRRAAVLGVPLQVPAAAEPAFGMGMLAAAAVDAGPGHEPDLVAAAARMVTVSEVVEPRSDPALHDRYASFRDAVATRGWSTT